MAITRIKNSSINNKTPKYNDVLAGLPFRPIIGTATDGGNGTSVSVAFTGNNVANGTITYTALSSPGSLTGTGTASPITVSGLTSGTAYTFQVKAGNSLGDSAYSVASNSVTPVTPTAFESIATSTPNGVSTVTFSSIPSTYQHLQLRVLAKTAADTYFRIRVNGDTTTNYSRHSLYGDGTSAGAQGNAVALSSFASLGTIVNVGGTQPAGLIFDFHDYASTTKNKTIREFSGSDMNGSGEVRLASSLWLSTSAIDSITFFTAGDNFSTGTTIALYGVKGA